jgi:nitrate/nitrite transporter NarK
MGYTMSTASKSLDRLGESRLVLSEDWLSVGIGLAIFLLALAGLSGTDFLGWVVTTSVWTDPAKALGPASKIYSDLGGTGALFATYFALLVVLSAAAAALRANVARFAVTFMAVFGIAYAS